ncbi:hypothetical protein AAMO2058_000530200 [Amorphochlora amoebiformis]
MPPPTRQPQPSAPPLMPLLSQLDNAGHGGIRDDPSVARNSVDMPRASATLGVQPSPGQMSHIDDYIGTLPRMACLATEEMSKRTHVGDEVYFAPETSVDSTQNGVMVVNKDKGRIGRLLRIEGRWLCPIVQQRLVGGMRVKLVGEVIVQARPVYSNEYLLVLTVHFFGSRSPMHALHAYLRNNGVALIRLPIVPRNPFGAVAGEPATRTAQPTQPSPPRPPVYRLTAAETEQQMEQMFDQLTSAQGTLDESNLTLPGLLTALKPHQRAGVRWMAMREGRTIASDTGNQRCILTSEVLWKHEDGAYINSVTGTVKKTRPREVLGGILADDMGMGKTVQILSLILSDPTPISEDMEFADRLGVGGTLVVCPLAAFPHWEREVEKHVYKDRIRVLTLHSAYRTKKQWTQTTNDFMTKAKEGGHQLILTTYTMLNNVLRKTTKNELFYWILSQKFRRVVLDEAHCIRSMKTRQFESVSMINATFAWCLTGTPLVNSELDVLALVHFLKVEPFHDQKALWRKAISNPIKEGDSLGLARLRTILRAIALRRNKTLLQDTEETRLPPKKVHMVKIELTEQERRIYDRVIEVFSMWFRDLFQRVGQEGVMRNFRKILGGMVRLKQVCCDPKIVPVDHLTWLMSDELSESERASLSRKLENIFQGNNSDKAVYEDGEEMCCLVCFDAINRNNAKITKCGHLFCVSCLKIILDDISPRCPMCRGDINARECVSPEEVKGSSALTYQDSDDQPSSKVQVLLHRLREIRDRAGEEKGAKSVVISQFRSFLDRIAVFLGKEGIQIAGDRWRSRRLPGDYLAGSTG